MARTNAVPDRSSPTEHRSSAHPPASRLRGRARTPDVIAIERGSQAGVEMAFTGDLCAVGSGIDADLVLMHDELVAEHAILERHGRHGTVHALAEGVSVGGRSVPPNGCRRARLPVRIDIGGATIVWNRAPRSSSSPLRALALPGAAATAIFAGLLASPVSSGSLGDLGAPVREAAARTAEAVVGPAIVAPAIVGPAIVAPPLDPITTAAVTTAAVTPGGEAVHVPSIRGTAQPERLEGSSPFPAQPGPRSLFEDHLRSLGAPALAGIALREDSGTIVAEGTIAPASESAWIDAQTWFDGRFGGSATLLNRVRSETPTDAPAPAIDAVWAGETPYVVVGKERLAIGSVTREGWRIVAIEADAVTLVREGRTLSMAF